ncbi:MAG: glycoside hydrolase family 1 protein [Oscillospiraceae bacterium]|nr:glycoside hydrolase family 1 protein [Oscillospiraceae bacterium]
MKFSIPKGMLMGVSTASMQIEGGDSNTNWNDWYKRGFIKDGTDPSIANDHWKYWREDIQLMADRGLQLYRFSVEWAKLMPSEGEIDESAVEHYRKELLLLKEKGIRPLLTIHHFSNPMWFEEKGAFEKRENLHYYLELVELVIDRFGDLCSDYITINEPNVYATNSYFFGSWPPGKKSVGSTLAVMENLAYCHLKAYRLIHEKREAMGFNDSMVGCANHVRIFAPKNPHNPWHCVGAKLTAFLFQNALTDAMTLAKFPFPLRNFGKLPRGEYTDFIGVNYYSRSTVSGIGDGVRENCPKNDLGWEIYPQGLVDCAKQLYAILPRPIWVTENGTCDNTDRFRCRYLYEHIKALSNSGLPFERYYHWCFCDNFEWVEGNSSKFGLVSVDEDSSERRLKKSGIFYSEIIKNGGVTDEMFENFVKYQEYDIR